MASIDLPPLAPSPPSSSIEPIPVLPPRPKSPSFYKRPLPSSCVPYASAEGKRLFRQALEEGNLEAYFPLSSQFITQNEPAYCGLATLTMVLNALEVDPQRKWKGSWRWYAEEMLDCCRPLSSVAQVGITLAEFTCLARCNGLSATVNSPNLLATPEETEAALAKFRKDLKAACRGDNMMAISYSRKSLGQTGDGHFSPIGGYSEKDDMVLILDVARFKYPSYWVTVDQAWESMKPLDKATGQPRGYSLLSLLPTTETSSAPLSLTSLTLNKSTWAALSQSLTKILLSAKPTTSAGELLTSIYQHIAHLPTPVLAARPTAALDLPQVIPTLRSTRLAQLASPADPLSPLFLLAILSSKSSLARLAESFLQSSEGQSALKSVEGQFGGSNADGAASAGSNDFMSEVKQFASSDQGKSLLSGIEGQFGGSDGQAGSTNLNNFAQKAEEFAQSDTGKKVISEFENETCPRGLTAESVDTSEKAATRTKK
ncbi:glutathione gamma-glutamylcysteinyltransferase [Pseudohyphozyma bogoriensis]|nr:glutathione gamma-glutamylcysteinyltransferase [Pseudohyphozyma bogoriensis]